MLNSNPNSSMALAKKKVFPLGVVLEMIPRAVRHTPGMSQEPVIQVALLSVLFSQGQQIFHSGSKEHLPSWVKKLCSLSSAEQRTWIAGLVEIFLKNAMLVSNGHLELSKISTLYLYFQGLLCCIRKSEGVRWCDSAQLKCFLLTASLYVAGVSEL